MPTYSNEKLGQWRQAEDTRLANAGKEVTQDLATAGKAVKAASAASLSRVLGPLLDISIGALDTDFASGVAYFRGIQIARQLKAKGTINSEEAEALPRTMAAKDFGEVQKIIEQ